jgi:Domain of unknown function (DUF1707)
VRLSDADRELLFERLKRHAAAGRLDVPELERRVEVLVAADTHEAAAVVLADLPPLGQDPPPQQRPRWGKGHGDADAPAPDWQPTNERFRDPRTNRVMRVWVDPGGARHYVVDS